MEEKIDFVLIWVDGGDKEWQKERNKYAGKDPEDLADYRFRDWENLKYWFRGVEKFAPWVNNVYFITCGHYPEWLNLNHPKLKFVKHEDYIPKEYLPTFNSHTIELNLHRIKDLSDKFVYFNDDMFLINKVEEDDFYKNSMPKLIAGLDAIALNDERFGHIMLNNIQLINRNFNKKEVFNKNILKWYYYRYGLKTLIKTLFLSSYSNFTCFNNPHMPVPLLKNTINELWEKENDILDKTSKDKFRTSEHVNQYIFSWYEIAKGNFIPQKGSFGKYYTITDNNKDIYDGIKRQKHKLICLNDVSNNFDFEKAKNEIIEAFETILPEKSTFEL